MTADICILNCTIVSPQGSNKGNIYIKDGIISAVTQSPLDIDDCHEVIDGTDLIVFAGMIDSHVHLRDGKFSYRESFLSGTIAAASSGVTSVLEMPGCDKPASKTENFIERCKEAKKQSFVNIGFYGGAGNDNINEIIPLAKAGAIGFKTFRMPPVKGREKEFYGLCSVSTDDLIRVMTEIKKTGLTLTIHSEDVKTVEENTKKIKSSGGKTILDFCASRPQEAEIISVKEAIYACKKTGCATIIAHVSSPVSVQLINRARQNGINIYAETCPQYIYFDESMIKNAGVFARIKPPIRDKSCVAMMQSLYSQGKISITGSDHAPYTYVEKLTGNNDIWKTFDGLPGLEMSIPLLLKLNEEGIISYETIARCTSYNTAHIFGLSNKGLIKAGMDADLFVVRYQKDAMLTNIHKFKTKCRESACIYDKIPIKHEVVMTIVSGKTVYKNKQIMTDNIYGKILRGSDYYKEV